MAAGTFGGLGLAAAAARRARGGDGLGAAAAALGAAGRASPWCGRSRRGLPFGPPEPPARPEPRPRGPCCWRLPPPPPADDGPDGAPLLTAWPEASELALELEVAGDLRDVGRVLAADVRDADAGAAGAARAADAVHVALAVLRRVEVDDVRDAVDVDAARGDVGGDERVDAAGLELRERLLALALALVAVHRERRVALVAQALDEPVGAALGADEDERQLVLGAAQLAQERVDAVAALDADEAVLDVGGLLDRRHVLVGERRRACTRGRSRRPRRRASRRRTASGGRRGHWATMRSTGGRKPMSSMRSASSRTRIFTWASDRSPRWMRSSRRPGVATMMWAVRASRACFSMPTPP